MLSFFSSRRNWDSPNPSTAGECAPPLPVLGGGAQSLVREGLEESQFRRGDIHCGTLYIYVLCGTDCWNFFTKLEQDFINFAYLLLRKAKTDNTTQFSSKLENNLEILTCHRGWNVHILCYKTISRYRPLIVNQPFRCLPSFIFHDKKIPVFPDIIQHACWLSYSLLFYSSEIE
jgi:hypothetical protein